jgi:hypothetical protein
MSEWPKMSDQKNPQAKFDEMNDEEIDAAVQNDPDAAPIADADWFAAATVVMPDQPAPIWFIAAPETALA